MRSLDGFVFDLDGTIYLGDQALPGAIETIAELRRRGKRTLFVTNKPLQSRDVYASKLTRLGIPTDPEKVITSAFVLGHHLKKTHPDLTYYVVGEDELRSELQGYGLKIAGEFLDQDSMDIIKPDGVDAVIVAFDRKLDYRKLNTAYQALCRGAKFFATNADKACPMPGGAIPDAGAIITALEHITDRKLELLAGKPSPLILQAALDLLQLPPERCMMIGDRLETDILMGQRAGFSTAVVLTGAATRHQLAAMEVPPDYVLNNVGEIPALIE